MIMDPLNLWIFSSVFSFIYSFIVISFLYKNHKWEKYDTCKLILKDYFKVFICALIISQVPLFNTIIAVCITVILIAAVIGWVIYFILDWKQAIIDIKEIIYNL